LLLSVGERRSGAAGVRVVAARAANFPSPEGLMSFVERESPEATPESRAAIAEETASAPPCAFYLICDSKFFIGAVAVLNSLRLVGHDEPVFLVDAGLEKWQHDALSRHVELMVVRNGIPPIMMKMIGPETYPADVAVVLDSDVIVTRPLTELIEIAASGRLVAFVNNAPNDVRFFPEWSSVLELGPMRRQPYLASGQLVVPATLGKRLFGPWEEGQTKVDAERTILGRGKLSDPFYFADMDVFNAVVSSRFEPQEIVMLENRLATIPPFHDLELVDRERLLVRYPNGEQPFLLHHIMAKPWLRSTRTNLYSLLLPRLLLAPDVTLRLRPDQVPLRLREGWRANADRRRAHVQAFAYEEGRRQLGRFGVRTRIAAWQARRSKVETS
jgi:hypothetical protein